MVGACRRGGSICNRVDRGDLESGHRLRPCFGWLPTLLRDDPREAPQGDGIGEISERRQPNNIRAGLRGHAASPKSRRAIPLAPAASRVRQFDVRPFCSGKHLTRSTVRQFTGTVCVPDSCRALRRLDLGRERVEHRVDCGHLESDDWSCDRISQSSPAPVAIRISLPHRHRARRSL